MVPDRAHPRNARDGQERETSMSGKNGILSTDDVVKDFLSGNLTEAPGESTWGTRAVEEHEYARAEESTLDSDESESGDDTPSDSSTEQVPDEAKSEKAPPQKTSADEEIITITDEKGQRKIRIDYNDKAKLKQAVQLAYGSRKWQAERDQAKAENTQLKAQHSELKTNWDTLESAYSKTGIAGVIDLLEGRQGAYQDHLKKAIDRQDFLRKASPEEIDALEAREAAQAKATEADRLRKEFEDFKKSVEATKEQAEVESLKASLNPAFDKYRFDGKLGNEKAEARLDKALWAEVIELLEPYEDKGMLTPELINKTFRDVALEMRKDMNLQAEKKASKVIEQKKQEATENAQAKIMSGYKSGGAAKEAQDLLANGNMKDLMKGWGKYRGFFGGK